MLLRKCFTGIVLILLSSPVIGMVKSSNDLLVDASFPMEVYSSSFTFPVSISNLVNRTRQLEVYSYVYEGSNCVSGVWTSNLEIIALEPYSVNFMNLTNELEEVNGIFAIKLRVRVIGILI